MVQHSLQKLGLCANLSKISNADQLLLAGVLSTPALAIDGQIVLSGRVPEQQQLEELLQKFISADSCNCKQGGNKQACDCEKHASACDCEKHAAACDCEKHAAACDCEKHAAACDCEKHAAACDCDKHAAACDCEKHAAACDCEKHAAACDCEKQAGKQQKSSGSGCCGGGSCCGGSGGINIFVRIAIWLLIALVITVAIQWMNGRI